MVTDINVHYTRECIFHHGELQHSSPRIYNYIYTLSFFFTSPIIVPGTYLSYAVGDVKQYKVSGKIAQTCWRVCWKLFSVPQDAGVAAVRSIENGSQLRELYKLSLPRCRNASTENNGLVPGSSSRPFFPSSLPPSAQTEFYP